jgi:glycosyltransferase involved in cell wall biosynthesis
MALLMEPGNVEQLATSIQRLIGEPGLREVLGRNARSLALERYTWKRHVHEILNGLRMAMAPQF